MIPRAIREALYDARSRKPRLFCSRHPKTRLDPAGECQKCEEMLMRFKPRHHDPTSRKGTPKKGVVPPHLRRFLFKKGHRKIKAYTSLPLPKNKKLRAHILASEKGTVARLPKRGYLKDYFQKPFDPPARWFEAMVHGLMKTSDIPESEARVHARRIWDKMPSGDRRKARWDAKAYDLPLPQDATHRGGVIRIVKPFNLAEAQIDVTPRVFEALARTGIFQRLRRGDGTVGLVKRAKSNKGNVNIFVDRRR